MLSAVNALDWHLGFIARDQGPERIDNQRADRPRKEEAEQTSYTLCIIVLIRPGGLGDPGNRMP